MNTDDIYNSAFRVPGVKIRRVTDAPGTVTVKAAVLYGKNPDWVAQARQAFEAQIEERRPPGTIYTVEWVE